MRSCWRTCSYPMRWFSATSLTAGTSPAECGPTSAPRSPVESVPTTRPQEPPVLPGGSEQVALLPGARLLGVVTRRLRGASRAPSDQISGLGPRKSASSFSVSRSVMAAVTRSMSSRSSAASRRLRSARSCSFTATPAAASAPDDPFLIDLTHPLFDLVGNARARDSASPDTPESSGRAEPPVERTTSVDSTTGNDFSRRGNPSVY